MNHNDKMSFTATHDRLARALVEEMAPFTERDRAVIEARQARTRNVERRRAELDMDDDRYATTALTLISVDYSGGTQK